MKDNTIITISKVILNSFLFFQPMVKPVQINIREILRKVVADWNISISLSTPYDILKKPKGIFAFNFSLQESHQNIVIYGGIIFPDVELQTILSILYIA